MNYRLLYLFAAAALVRFVSITQSLWLDEATTANVVKNLSAQQILSQFSPVDFHPPLYYLFMNIWTQVFGYSEIILRMPSIIFSLLAGYFVYKIGKLIGNEKIAFASALFFLFNPLVVYYSQETRMYMMITALVTIALYYLLVLVRSKKLSKQTRMHAFIGFNIAAGLSLATFYGSFFFFAVIYLYLLFKKQYKLLTALLPGPILSLIIVSPLLLKQLEQAKVALEYVKNWNLVLGIPSIKNALLIPLKFTTGRISFEPKIFYYGIGLVSTLIVWFFAGRGGFRQRGLLFLGLGTLVLAFIFSFTTPLYQYFRFVYLIPILALLLGYGTRVYKWERYLVSAIFILFTMGYLINPIFHREDWKHVLISVPESKPVLMIPSATDPMQYYYPGRKLDNLFEVDTTKYTQKELFVIPYTAEIYGFDYRTPLQKQKFTLKEVENYRGVTLEYWTR